MVSLEGDARRFEEILEQVSKSFQLLIVANGTALIACLAALKDYAATPAYKGVGLLVVCFIVGIISAIFGYMFMLGERIVFAKFILSRKREKRQGWITTMAFICGGTSLTALIYALSRIGFAVYAM